MKLNLSPEWYEQEGRKEAASPPMSITAGLSTLEVPKVDAPPVQTRAASRDGAPLALGRLINLTRRNLGWTLEKLSEQADVDLEELMEIELEGDCPEPRTVYNLAAALNLPVTKLLSLSGLARVEDQRVREAALRFAARSEPVQQLNDTEREALEEFIEFLNER